MVALPQLIQALAVAVAVPPLPPAIALVVQAVQELFMSGSSRNGKKTSCSRG